MQQVRLFTLIVATFSALVARIWASYNGKAGRWSHVSGRCNGDLFTIYSYLSRLLTSLPCRWVVTGGGELPDRRVTCGSTILVGSWVRLSASHIVPTEHLTFHIVQYRVASGHQLKGFWVGPGHNLWPSSDYQAVKTRTF